MAKAPSTSQTCSKNTVLPDLPDQVNYIDWDIDIDRGRQLLAAMLSWLWNCLPLGY